MLGPVLDLDHEIEARDAVEVALQAERLAELGPTTLACMHGSAWTGDGAGLIRELAARLEVGESVAAR